MTLQFYSSKAYDFLRQEFENVLPHPRSIRNGYAKIKCDPGFTEPAFIALENIAKINEETICALMIDEMAIKSSVAYSHQGLQGYVDLGGGAQSEFLPLAKDVLVFMVVSLNCSWKIPVAYFLINGLNGAERVNLGFSVCSPFLSWYYFYDVQCL